MHQGFDGVGVYGTGEAFVFCLYSADHGHCHELLGEGGVDLLHLEGLFLGFLGGGVGGVAFLPEELGGPEEQAGAHLPTDHVGPLVDQQGQVAVAGDPVAVGVPNDGFGGRANDEFFL